MNIRLRILHLCEIYHITPTELAARSCLTQSTVNNITSGRNKSITVSTLEKICDGFGITLAEFFDPIKHLDTSSEKASELLEYENYLIQKYNVKKPSRTRLR